MCPDVLSENASLASGESSPVKEKQLLLELLSSGAPYSVVIVERAIIGCLSDTSVRLTTLLELPSFAAWTSRLVFTGFGGKFTLGALVDAGACAISGLIASIGRRELLNFHAVPP